MKKENKEEFVKVCLNCGSTEVQVDFSNPVVWAYGTPVNYKCKSCGHIASVFPDVKNEEIKDFKSKIIQNREEKNQIVDVKTGFTVFNMEIILLIIVIITGAIATIFASYWSGVILLVGGLYLIKLIRRNKSK